MGSVSRNDSFTLESYETTSNGFLNISGIVTRTGVFRYDEGNELRPHDEVLKPESLDSMFAVPVTWEHPPDLLTPETIPMYQKGFVASKPEIVTLGETMHAVKLSNIVIQDPSLIHEIVKNGLSEFSLGYSCDIDEHSGRFDSEEYARIQRNIVYNHLAVVKDARCGKICSIITEEKPMANGYKADCACQKTKRKDADEKEKDPKASSLKSDEAEMEDKEKKKDDDEESMSGWKEKCDKILDMLGKLMKLQQKDVDKDDSEDDEDKEKEKDMKKKDMKKKDKEKEDKEEDKDDSYEDEDPEAEEEDVKKQHEKEAKAKESKKDSRRRDSINNFSFRTDPDEDDTPKFVVCTRESYATTLKKGK